MKRHRITRRILLTALLLALSATTQCGRLDAGTPSTENHFFVAPNGKDSNPGTLAAPFLTLRRCQSAMQDSVASTKTCTIRAGLYVMAAPLTLTQADNGEIWQYYAPDGVNSAVLDGRGSVDIVHNFGGSHITIDGLKMRNFKAYGIWQVGGGGQGRGRRHPVASGNTYVNNDIGFNTVTSWNAAAIYCDGANPKTTIRNNYVHDLGSMGVAMNSYYDPADDFDGSVIENNVILRTVQRMSDGGAIYLEMFAGQQHTHVMIANNFIRDYGAPGISGATGIYLDQGSSNVTVTGNIIGPPTEGSVGSGNGGAFGFQVNTGHDNHISGNILDLGNSGRVWIASWYWEAKAAYSSDTSGNTFTGNIIVSGFRGSQTTNFTGTRGFSYFQHPSEPTSPTIRDNVYYSYTGGQVRTDGNITGDSHPIFKNPRLSGRTYQLAEGNPAVDGPVDFKPIVGGWGPPGFVIPMAGTAASAR